MAKKDMKHPEDTQNWLRKGAPPVPEVQYSTKHGEIDAKTITSGGQKPRRSGPNTGEPVSDVYPAIDTDLARDNVENDLTAADRQDL